MRLTEEIEVCGTRVTVKELTLGEIRQWLGARESGNEADLIGGLLLEDCRVDELARFCDVPAEKFDDLTQSELIALRDIAKRLNPSFFGLMARLQDLARKMVLPASSEASAPSSPAAT